MPSRWLSPRGAITLAGLPAGSTVKISVDGVDGAGHSDTAGPVQGHLP